MRASLLLLFALVVSFSIGCNQSAKPQKVSLSKQDLFYCDSLKIDSSIIVLLRILTDSAVIPFPGNSQSIFHEDSTIAQVPGLVFNATDSSTNKIVAYLSDYFLAKGYSIFTLDEQFGIEGHPNTLAILKTTDKYQILRQVGTNGINYDITNDSLLHIIKTFDQKYGLQLTGASGDWCQFKINMPPVNWLTFAKEAYKVCPDIVEQGAGDVDNLAEEMQRTGVLYFWWD